MPTIDSDTKARVARALEICRFAAAGALVSDLDGTAVHQERDLVMIAEPVQRGLEAIRNCGRPVIINTLRFPLSIMRTFGRQWAAWTERPLPCVTLNGSLIGDIVQSAGGALVFEERAAFPLRPDELGHVLATLETALEAGADRLTLFVYQRDWQQGELVWTPRADRIDQLRRKYVSATTVVSTSAAELRSRLAATDVCMMAILVEDPADERLAFQQGRASSFVTSAGIDKRTGARHLAALLGADMTSSIGAGDTELDNFLDGIGFALIVGAAPLTFAGLHDTLRLSDPFALGEVLAEIVAHCERKLP